MKSGADGKFHIAQDAQGPGPRLVQAAYDGVTYNRILPPGSPSNDVTVEVYNSSKQPGSAKVAQHVVLFEPVRGQLMVSEIYIFRNDGKMTYNDVDAGTLRFFLPPAANGAVQSERDGAAGYAGPAGRGKDARRRMFTNWPSLSNRGKQELISGTICLLRRPAHSRARFSTKAAPTRLVAPNGVTIKGANIRSIGQEPRTQASIYDVTGRRFQGRDFRNRRVPAADR